MAMIGLKISSIASLSARLNDAGIRPNDVADRYTLIRRIYFDLTGLPPAPREVLRFVNDQRPDAFARVVDELLASIHYGERWGRHWLDVARYADSNGGDENHAYPLAHRYRDYVIAAVNADVPYDHFIAQQLAGDLLEPTDDERLNRMQLTATGYLAIGMKILAEQDPVKKRADMVDEQIDTLGRTFLGLSLGCARCHDHKFDPISTRDYYSLAGVFHSSQVEDKPLSSRKFEQRLAAYRSQREQLERQIAQTQTALESAGGMTREAESFDRGNVIIDTDNYGKGIGVISDPSGQLNFAEYDLRMETAGRFLVQLRYAAESARPGRILVNDVVVKSNAISTVTGGWHPDAQQWHIEGAFDFQAGSNTLRIESEPMMSHIDKLRLTSVENADRELWQRLESWQARLEKLDEHKPKPVMVMATEDRDAHDIRLHVRGSHLDLGDQIPRGFPEVLGGNQLAIPTNASGRLQLAHWLTQNPKAARLTSRVIVNRLWHWHFGRGLVTTPDDFGIRGESPSHPRLLDFLAAKLIDEKWSLKVVQRIIVTSKTFQLASTMNDNAHTRDPTNRRYWRRNRQRMNAETLRDALLFHAGDLASMLGQSPMTVKSQDPSPEDARQNLSIYEGSHRRSVYLPVVRSNVYEFLTLFDFPNASTPVGRRNETTIPTQALWLMNSPFIVRQTERIAESLQSGDDEDDIRLLYLKLYGRPALDSEVQSGRLFLQRIRSARRNAVSDPSAADRRAWSTYCQVLLSCNEYLYLN